MSRSWLTTILAGAAVLALVAAAWQTHRWSKLQRAAAGVMAEIESIRARAEKAEADNASLRLLAGMPPAAAPQAPLAPAARHAAPAPADFEQARLAIQLRENLRAANATIAELEMRAGLLDEKLGRAAEENQRLSAEGQELRDRVDATVRVVDAMRTEMKSRNERLLQLELANKKLREQISAASERVTRTQQAIRDMEEINRRRENLLTSIARRFRDLTEQYRAIAVRLDSQGERAAAVPGELSRIQNVVALAEEDLKQIANLNAQAARAQAALAK